MKFLLLLFFVAASPALAQHVDCSSKKIFITGAVVPGKIIGLKTLDSFTTVKLADVTITNHTGEVKRTMTNLEGVLLKDVLQKAEIKSDSPKTLSEFYFVFTACDGYKVVYSWNEIFNSATGDNIYLIKEKNGENLSSITISDKMTGRRYIQGLSMITINRVQ